MFIFSDILITNNRKLKQTLESSPYGLEIIFKGHCEGLSLIILSIMMKKKLVPKSILSSRPECKSLVLFETKITYIATLFLTKTAKNHTLWGCAYRLCNPYTVTAYPRNLAIRCKANISWPQICTALRRSVATSLTHPPLPAIAH